MAHGFGVVTMRARADLRRRWPTFLVLALLVGGLAAGVMAAAAGARRTASAYPRLLAASDSVDVILPRDESTLVEEISADPAVSEAVAIDALSGRFFLEKGGTLLADCTVNEMSVIVSDDRRWGTDVHRLLVRSGRAADPARAREVVVGTEIARRAGLVPGDRILARLGRSCEWDEGPTLPVTLTVVGIALDPLVVSTEPGISVQALYGTPALGELARQATIGRDRGVAVRRHSGGESSELDRRVDAGAVWDARRQRASVQRLIAPDVTALRLVAVLGAVGGLLVLLPVVMRAERRLVPDRGALGAIGLTARDLGRLGLLHGLTVVAGAAVVAAVVSGLASGLTPVAEARAFEPDRGFRLDVPVLAGGVLVLLVLLPLTMGLVGRMAPSAAALPTRPSWTSRLAARGWVGVVRASGLRLAFEERSGHARSTGYYLAEVVAVATVVAGVTFGAGVQRLQETPRLVGWNWDLSVGTEDRADDMVQYLLAQPEVERASAGTFWSQGVTLGSEQIQPWLVTFGTGPRAVAGTVIEGRAPVGPEEVLVHPRLLSRLGVGIGEIVPLTYRPDPEGDDPMPAAAVTGALTIVGTGVMPTDAGQFEATAAMTFDGLARLNPGLEPHMIMVGTSGTEAAETVRQRLMDVYGLRDDDVSVTDDIRVGSAISAQSLGGAERVPEVLGGLMAALGAAVLVYLVVDRVREARRDLAIHRSLGFTARDVRRSVATASTAMVFGVLVVGVPLGVLAGVKAWLAYAERLGVKPEAVVVGREVVFVIVAAVIVANLAAIVPGRLAARRPPALLLRAE